MELQISSEGASHAPKPTRGTLIAEGTTDKARTDGILSMRVAFAIQQPAAIGEYWEKPYNALAVYFSCGLTILGYFPPTCVQLACLKAPFGSGAHKTERDRVSPSLFFP